MKKLSIKAGLSVVFCYRKEMGAEPEMMHVEAVDREGLRRRVKDPFYQNRTERIRKDKRTKNNGKIIFPLRRDGQFEIC